MRRRFEDPPAIGALPLENRTRIMERVRQDVHLGVPPVDHAAIHPDPAITIVKGLGGHGVFPLFRASGFGFLAIGVTWVASLMVSRITRGPHYVNIADLIGSSMSSDVSKTGPPSPRRGEEAMNELIELFFFAYRDFVGDADRLLEAYGFGRAHHRVLYFVSRRPGLTLAE